MIDARGEGDFLWRGLRALIGFRLSAGKAWLRHGHIVRRRAIDRYLQSQAVRKLHLGATFEAEGFLNSQICGHIPIDITRPLPLPDQSIDLIYSSHVVEHVHRRQFHAFLAEAHRVLRPGGIHLIATPALRKIIDVLYGEDDAARDLLLARGAKWSWEGYHTPNQQINVTMRAFGHRWLLDRDYMRGAAQRAGYSDMRVIDNLELPDPALRAYIAARKPPAWHLETETYSLMK